MGVLTNLEGMSANEIECNLAKQFFRSVTAGLRLLKTERVAVSAGDHGSVIIWIDDSGKYRGSFSKFFTTVDSICVSTKKDLAVWLREWLPKQDKA